MCIMLFYLSNEDYDSSVIFFFYSATNGPSARSGHRMVAYKKKLFVFGGFHDNGYDFKYFNDVFIFDLENFKWIKLDVAGLNSSLSSSGYDNTLLILNLKPL